MRTIAIIPVIVVLLSACSAPAPYKQSVDGVVRRGSSAVANLPVRFYMDSPADTTPCRTWVAEASTDKDGRFVLEAAYRPKHMEAFAVLVQRHSVCVNLNGAWIPAWQFVTGPALKHMSLECIMQSNDSVSCMSNVRAQLAVQADVLAFRGFAAPGKAAA